MFIALADFADQHEDLDAAFRAHQVALIALDLSRARERLGSFSSLLSGHMGVEEEILIPAFAELVGDLPRVGPQMIRDEHAKLLIKLRRIEEALEELLGRERVEHADVLELLEEELGFKRLLHHHDERERAGMFALLDRELSGEELEHLWQRVERYETGHAERWVAESRT